jgi:hypothetical protein
MACSNRPIREPSSPGCSRLVGPVAVHGAVQPLREAIAPPRNRRDRLRAEQLAQGRDLNLQIVFLDHQTGPDQIEQFMLADHPVAALDQRQQHVEGARTEFGSLAVDQEPACVGLDQKTAEREIPEGDWTVTGVSR